MASPSTSNSSGSVKVQGGVDNLGEELERSGLLVVEGLEWVDVNGGRGRGKSCKGDEGRIYAFISAAISSNSGFLTRRISSEIQVPEIEAESSRDGDISDPAQVSELGMLFASIAV